MNQLSKQAKLVQKIYETYPNEVAEYMRNRALCYADFVDSPEATRNLFDDGFFDPLFSNPYLLSDTAYKDMILEYNDVVEETGIQGEPDENFLIASIWVNTLMTCNVHCIYDQIITKFVDIQLNGL